MVHACSYVLRRQPIPTNSIWRMGTRSPKFLLSNGRRYYQQISNTHVLWVQHYDWTNAHALTSKELFLKNHSTVVRYVRMLYGIYASCLTGCQIVTINQTTEPVEPRASHIICDNLHRFHIISQTHQNLKILYVIVCHMCTSVRSPFTRHMTNMTWHIIHANPECSPKDMTIYHINPSSTYRLFIYAISARIRWMTKSALSG